MRIALVPLDERPVNRNLPAEIAGVAGISVAVPPRDLLPDVRTPADVDRLGDWLAGELEAGATDAVVCLDTLVYGGLIAARTTPDDLVTCLGRLERLRTLRSAHPSARISAVSLVMRASNSYTATEEPEYWGQYGKELHALGGHLQRVVEAEFTGRAAPGASPAESVPADVVGDFETRRLRNHVVNLAAVGLLHDGTLDFLAVTADDTAPYTAGTLEQYWIRHWARALPGARSLLSYPGADEVGAVLVARALCRAVGTRPAVEVWPGDPAGLSLVPNFENEPLSGAVRRQLAAAGALAVEHTGDGTAPDAVLVVHTPDPAGTDCFAAPPLADHAAVDATVAAVRSALGRGVDVAIADVRYSNGGDPALVAALDAEGLLDAVVAYGGWNTAGNALGGVVAHLVARAAGRGLGTLDEAASRRALARRLLDDVGYQSVVRHGRVQEVFGGTNTPVPPLDARRAADLVAEDLRAWWSGLGSALSREVRLESVALPWRRSFEVDLDVRSEMARQVS